MPSSLLLPAAAGSYCAPYAALPPSYTNWVHIGSWTGLRSCVEINDNNKVAGQPVQQWECVGVPAQEWKMQAVGNDTKGEWSWYRISAGTVRTWRRVEDEMRVA